MPGFSKRTLAAWTAMLAVGIGAVIAVFFWSMSVLRRCCAYEEALDSPGCWDGCVSEACGHFRGESFALRDGKAVVTAPAGRHWYLLSDYSRDFDSDGPAKLRKWLLETHPQWCAKDARRTYFVLQARAMDADGCVGFGETANEDTLLLFWRGNDKPNGDWGCTYLGNRLYPLLDNANSVSINGEWLGIETSWRSTRNGGSPVIYQLEEINGEIGVGIYDYTSSILHDGKAILYVQERDALQPSRYADSKYEKLHSHYFALWRHPLEDYAFYHFALRERPQSPNCFNPIPALDAEPHEFDMGDEIGDTLAAVYADRSDFEILSFADMTEKAEKKLVRNWRHAKEPPLLTIRAVTEYGIENSVMQERVDYSFSRDGAYLVIEDGYRIPETETPDGLTHSRAMDRTVFLIPESRRGEVLAALEKAAGQPAD